MLTARGRQEKLTEKRCGGNSCASGSKIVFIGIAGGTARGASRRNCPLKESALDADNFALDERRRVAGNQGEKVCSQNNGFRSRTSDKPEFTDTGGKSAADCRSSHRRRRYLFAVVVRLVAFLAVWQDKLMRQIIGWADSSRMTDELVIVALKKALLGDLVKRSDDSH